MMDWLEDLERIQGRYQRDGFVAIPGFLSPDELAELKENVDRFISTVAPNLPREDVFYEDKADRTTLKQIQKMGDHDSYFRDWYVRGPFRTLAEKLLQSEVVPRNLQHFNKPPAVGKPTPPHQDGYYFMLEPCEALTIWLALEKVDAENGCVRYLAGSHQQGMRPHGRTQTLGFSQGITNYSDAERAMEIPCPAEPGDVLAHHALTIHRADGNHSPTRSRKSLGFVYFSEHAKIDREAAEAYRQKLTQEMVDAGQV